MKIQGTDCGKSFPAEQRPPARRIFAAALLVSGALLASCKSEPAAPVYVNVPVAAPSQADGGQATQPVQGGSQLLSNPHMVAPDRAVGKRPGRSGKQGRGSNALGEPLDAGAEQEAAPDASQGGRGVSDPWEGVQPQNPGQEADAGPTDAGDAQQGGRGVTNPWGSPAQAPDATDSNRGGSNPYNDSADSGSVPEGRAAPNAWETPRSQDAGTAQEAGAEASQGGRGVSPPWSK